MLIVSLCRLRELYVPEFRGPISVELIMLTYGADQQLSGSRSLLSLNDIVNATA
jgi:hypothetical protein